ncbi:unnamed protein product (macronuclear) [Paramecium tetraurelia]|uniref:V-type proton ATPase proteolipid subunit n=1 Tax=Paramecium tetraurelia TaxID=5888 RepID=Q7Z105_PARTE|nr:uncharacterized protein GSPATT00013256001 [Paramecium tetraurelia]CAD97572.1 proteolipid c subunit [Paramecium tetraurelia]CAK77791.1 unnamed protein product [Paramecium tetraurelia]|eukprot:XP_001445188.1 hypothetical protein (macronuclear) [Paramecium tetraurelia strain d4-2]
MGDSDIIEPSAYFFGYIGVASAVVFANLGSSYGATKSGVGICSMGVLKPDLIMKSVIPVVMAGILGIYGMIVGVILQGKVSSITAQSASKQGYAYLSAGLCCGLSSLAAGLSIGIVGDAGVRANAQQDRIFVGMILILIFAEALALYGLIVSLILSQTS